MHSSPRNLEYHGDRHFKRIVPPPNVPDRASFREIVPPRTSCLKSEAGEMAASTLASSGFALPGAIPAPERTGRSVAPGFGLIVPRGSVNRCCPVGSVPAIFAACLVDLRPGRLVGRRIDQVEPQCGQRRRDRLAVVCQERAPGRRSIGACGSWAESPDGPDGPAVPTG